MKSEDLFEALTDIDDDLVYKAKAKQLKETGTGEDYAEPIEPTYITVTKRKFPWRATACAVIAAVVTVSAGAAFLYGGGLSLPSEQGGVNGADIAPKIAEYPEEAKYVYTGDFFELTPIIGGEQGQSAYDIYDTMERDSDLVVYGTFTDDAHQTFDPEIATDIFDPTANLHSYNKFKIDKIFKSDGSVREGDEIIILQGYAVYNSNLGTYNSGLTPMIKGDEWFYCLTKSPDSDFYYVTGDVSGRYASFDSPPQSDYTRSFETPGLFNNTYYKQNINQLVNERYLEKNFEPYTNHMINYLKDNETVDLFERTETFEIAEFPGVYFVWNAYDLKAVRGDKEEVLYSGMPIWDLHLSDLNGDGKREICSTVSIGSGIIDERIMAVDYANGDVYELSDRGNYDYSVFTDFNGEGMQYARKEYNSYGEEADKHGALTLDIMQKLGGGTENNDFSYLNQCILDLNSGSNTVGWDETFTFTMPEFPEAEFKWISSEKLVVSANGKNITLFSGNPIWDIYLYDLNGDGKREICSDISVGTETTDHRIAVFDYENGEQYELSDSGNYDYRIDGTKTMLSSDFRALYYSKLFSNGETAEGGTLSLDIMKKIATVVIDDGNVDASAYEIPNNAENTNLEQAHVFEGEAGDEINPQNFKIYEPFGMTYESEKKGLYYNGKKVRWFEDYYPIDGDGNQAGMDYINETGVVDVYAVRDFSDLKRNPDGSFDPSGKLIGLKEFSAEEFAARDIKAALADQQVTHIAYAEDDSVAVETDSGNVGTVVDDSVTVEEATNAVLSKEEEAKAREEHLKMEEEYKPFGVTYDEKEDQWYFNGEKVRYFRDILTSNGESLTGGKFHGAMRTMSGVGSVDIYTVRDFGETDENGVGKLIGIKAFGEGRSTRTRYW